MMPAEPLRILVVDDEPDLCELLAMELEGAGFRCHTAHNGKEAMVVVESEKIDVVVSDKRMPECDGLELLAAVKARDPRIPVILFVTGFSESDIQTAFARGAAAVFSKPIDYDALTSAIRRALVPARERWADARAAHPERRLSVRVPSLAEADRKHQLRLGAGGMFVACSPQEMFGLAPDSLISFHIQFDEGELRLIEGEGIVRWLRASARGPAIAGVGIEFLHLADTCRESVAQAVESLSSRAFLPQ